MSVKIFTCHATINYGAILQSLSLKTFIENETCIQSKFSDYQPKKLVYAEYFKPLITKNLFKLKSLLIKNYKIYRWKKKLNKDYSISEDKIIKNNEPISIYGSDEIWNFQNPYFGYDPHFFGSNNNSKKISYGVSIGRAKFDSLTEEQIIEIKKNLQKFRFISVRDSNTAKFVNKLINITPEIVVDPTFLTTPPILEDQNLFDKRTNENYVIVYGTVFSKDQKNQIYEFCKKRNLKIISVGYYNKWIKENYLDLDPTGFFQLIKKSDFIFTSMFHGIMFSTKLKKQFFYSVDLIRENKINYFINKLELNFRELNKNTNFSKEINYDDVYQILDNWVKYSKKFLLNSINS